MLEFFDNERGGAFADNKAVTQFIERPAGFLRILAAAHRLDDIKRTDCDRG